MHTDAWKTVSVSSVQVLHVRHYMYVYNNCSSFKLSYLQVLPVSDYSADSRFLTSTKQHYSLYNKEISDRIRQRCLQSSDINKALHGGRSVTNYQETLPPVTRHRLDYRLLVLETGPSSQGVIRRIRDRSGPSRLVSLYSWSCLMQPERVQNTCKYFYDVYQGFWRI